jgi:hypothetical protein
MTCCTSALEALPEALALGDAAAPVAGALAAGAGVELEELEGLLLQPAAASDAIAAMARKPVVLFRRRVADRSAWSDMATFPSALLGAWSTYSG